MTSPADFSDDLGPGSEEDLIALARRLDDARPVPRPAFRGDLGRHLAARSRRRFGPVALPVLIAGNALAGAVLLCVGAIGAAGVGPLS